jgi:DNA-directed RNA polymerase specialized sigma24 family protein
MNISAVKTTLFRAREILRNRLGSRLKDFHNRWGVS